MSAVTHVGLGVGALVICASGVWLTRAGRPFSTATLTVHKLVALACVVVVAVLAWRVGRATSLSAGEWAGIAAAVVLCVAAFVSGGVASAMEPAPASVVWAHRVGSWLAVVAVGWVWYALVVAA